MPKAYSEQERDYIKQRLMEEAELCLRQYGVRKTTVDELVKRAGIPKGTFYLFYESKELLFFDVLLCVHDTLHQTLLRQINKRSESVTPQQLTDQMVALYQFVEESFLLKLITGGELELLLRKLPPEIAAEHAKQDDLSVEMLVSLVPGMQQERVLYSALRCEVFFCPWWAAN